MSMYPFYPSGFLYKNLERCRLKTACEGGCCPHADGIVVVRVVDRSTIREYDWGYFTYCPSAIKEDKARGFSVLSEGDEGFEPYTEEAK